MLTLPDTCNKDRIFPNGPKNRVFFHKPAMAESFSSTPGDDAQWIFIQLRKALCCGPFFLFFWQACSSGFRPFYAPSS
jgi:hypothetical protein